MDWDSYRLRYVNAKKAIFQSRVTSLAAHEALKDFPKNLSPKQNKEIKGLLNKLLDIGDKIDQDSNISIYSQPNSQKFETKHHVGTITGSVFHFLILHALEGKGIEHINFEPLLLSQELIILIAHVDAFISDSIRAMCKVNPKIMISEKKISWRDIIEAENWDNLISFLIEEHSYKLGWESITNRINHICERHGLKISISDAIRRLSEAEQLRHIIIHNGSRVSQEYLKKTGRTDVELDELIIITQEYTKQVAEDALLLINNLFLSISNKFFGVDIEENDDFLLGFPVSQ